MSASSSDLNSQGTCLHGEGDVEQGGLGPGAADELEPDGEPGLVIPNLTELNKLNVGHVCFNSAQEEITAGASIGIKHTLTVMAGRPRKFPEIEYRTSAAV